MNDVLVCVDTVLSWMKYTHQTHQTTCLCDISLFISYFRLLRSFITNPYQQKNAKQQPLKEWQPGRHPLKRQRKKKHGRTVEPNENQRRRHLLGLPIQVTLAFRSGAAEPEETPPFCGVVFLFSTIARFIGYWGFYWGLFQL